MVCVECLCLGIRVKPLTVPISVRQKGGLNPKSSPFEGSKAGSGPLELCQCARR